MALYYYTRWGGSKNNSCPSSYAQSAGYKLVQRLRHEREKQTCWDYHRPSRSAFAISCYRWPGYWCGQLTSRTRYCRSLPSPTLTRPITDLLSSLATSNVTKDFALTWSAYLPFEFQTNAPELSTINQSSINLQSICTYLQITYLL
jgi:hypothetical protein